MADDFGGKGYTKWAQYARALGADVDIGIGAVAPSTSSLRKLQARGLWNTLRDIFIPTLEKTRRLEAVETLAPDLVSPARKLITAEGRVGTLLNQARNAQRIRGAMGERAMLRLAPLLQAAQDTVNRMTIELQDNLMRRALVIYNVTNKSRGIEGQQRMIQQAYQTMKGKPLGREERIKPVERIPARGALDRERLRLQSASGGRRLRIVRDERQRVPRGQRGRVVREEQERGQRFYRHERTQRVERHERRPRYPKYPRFRKEEKTTISLKAKTPKGILVPEGSIAWKQGIVWKYIPPPWKQEKPISLRHPPVGAQFIGAKTPKQTIQMIGKPKARVPKSVSVDLGVVDILIENYGEKISFTGEGEMTSVGGSIAGTTRGMSIPAMSPSFRRYKRHKPKSRKLVQSVSI
jgi:hypothetical protein